MKTIKQYKDMIKTFTEIENNYEYQTEINGTIFSFKFMFSNGDNPIIRIRHEIEEDNNRYWIFDDDITDTLLNNKNYIDNETYIIDILNKLEIIYNKTQLDNLLINNITERKVNKI